MRPLIETRINLAAPDTAEPFAAHICMDPDPAYRPQVTYGQAVQENHSLNRLPVAAAAGLAAALIGALLWAALVGATKFKIGYAAIGIGYLVGITMRGVAKGHNPVYGYIGALLALLGCVVGDVLSDCVFVAEQAGRPMLEVLGHLTPAAAADLLKLGFKPLDALFYFIAASAGYRNAFLKG